MSDLSPDQRQIVNGAHNASRLLLIGWLCAIAVLVAKLLSHKRTITIAGIDFPVQYAWVLFAVLTLAHIFVGSFLVKSIKIYLAKDPDPFDQLDTFDEIRVQSNPFVHGLIPRLKPAGPQGAWYRMEASDPSAWVACVATLVLFSVLLPWSLGTDGALHWGSGTRFWVFSGVALVLTDANWLAASAWIVWLSRLQESAKVGMRGEYLMTYSPINMRAFDQPTRSVPFVVRALFVVLGVASALVLIPILVLLAPTLHKGVRNRQDASSTDAPGHAE